MKRLIGLLLLIVLWGGSLVQAQTIVITGRVVDENEQALSGANLRVANTMLGAISRADGRFALKLDADLEAEIIVSFMGYQSQSLVAGPGSTDLGTVQLHPSPFLADEVVVTATRAGEQTPMAYDNVSEKEINALNMGQDMGYLLRLTPSLVQSSESGTGIGYTNFRIRGSDPSRINITVDGIPLNDAESQQVFWVNMPAFSTSLSSVQVQRGVGTSGNGAAAFGATVNMQTAAPSQEARGSLSSTFGSYNTLINTIEAGTGLIKDKLAIDMRYSTLKSDGYVDYTSSDNRSAQFTGSYFLKHGRIKANIILGEQHSGIGWWGIDKETLKTNRTFNPAGQYKTPDGEERYYEKQTDNYWQNHYHLLYATSLGQNLRLNTGLFYTQGRGYYEQFKQDQELAKYYLPPVVIGTDSISNSDLARRKWLDNDFYGGVFSLHYKKEAFKMVAGGGLNHYDGDHFGRIIWMRFAGKTEKEHEWYRNRGEKTDGNLYLKGNWQSARGINLFADLQYRYVAYQMSGIDDDGYKRVLDQSHSFHFLNPKVGLQYEIDATQRAYASLSVGHREPTRQNFKDATGDEEATPSAEELRDLEAGYEFSSTHLAASINFYYMDYVNQLVPTGELSTDGYPIMSNVESSYRTGMELSLGLMPLSFVKWDASLTLSRNRIRNFVESYVDYDSETWAGTEKTREMGDTHIAYSPSVISSSDLCISVLRRLDVHLLSQYVSEQYFVNTMNEDMKIDAWFVNSLRFDYPLQIKGLGTLGLHFQVNNLFNALYANNAYGGTWWSDGTEYSWSAYFPQATRHFMAKISLNF
ncbi:MAG: TonB-dependent receptor [Bacteroidetes bacterium]|nr:MAG: TonB-dependent receptor [Bacteroidota bacterium]